jgi:hypothetical protein
MNVGATTGKEPDHVADEDLLSVDQMRGAMKEISAAALTNIEKATVAGCIAEVAALKAMMLEYAEQNNRLVNLYSTMKAEFEQFKALHAASMSVGIAGGSTTKEDIGTP